MIIRDYDIRGVYNEQFDNDFAELLGRAHASYVAKTLGIKNPFLTVGHDARLSSPDLAAAVTSGMKNVAFYYDANTSSYYFYSTLFDNLQEAQQEIKTKASNTSASKMVIIKVEN